MLVAWAREDRLVLIFPRVPVETPAPPVLGKETLAGLRLSECPFAKFGIKEKVDGRLSLVVRKYDLTRTAAHED